MTDDLNSEPAEPSADAAPGEQPSEAPPVDPVMERLAAHTAGTYRIERELGRGGMATVYLAHDIALDRQVAIKVMGQDLLAADPVVVDRFLREARTGAKLNHPHIIPVYAIGEKKDLIYFVMKYIDGKPLDDVIHTFGALPIPLVARVIAQVADALAYAHRNGIVHRDIKPANLMLDKEGWVVLTDLGIAKVQSASMLTATGSAVGTPTYMSPEQSAGSRETTGAADQYSLGCVAFEMLAGKPPFEGDSVISLIFQHHADPPPPLQNLRPDCPPEIVSAVARMLQKAPEDRFPSMEEVAQLFRDASAGDEEEYRLLLRAFATGSETGEAVKRVNTPRTPAPRSSAAAARLSTPSRPLAKPTSREIAVNTTGLKPVALRDPTLSRTPAGSKAAVSTTGSIDVPVANAADAAKATATHWPRTLLKPPEQAKRSTLRFRVPGVFTLLLVAGFTWFAWFPPIGSLDDTVPTPTAIMKLRAKEAEAAVRRSGGSAADGNCDGVRADLASCQRHVPVGFDDIAPVMIEATLAGIDPRFNERQGNDWAAMRRAAGYPREAFEWSNGVDRADLFAVVPRLLNHMETVGRTGSLTQRLVQHLYFPPNDGLFRKLREIRTSRRIAKSLPRERIIALYLNVAEFGPGLYGVEAAAQKYFPGTSAKDLTRQQAAILAATLSTPRTSNPAFQPSQMRTRAALIEGRLRGESVVIPPDIAPAATTARAQ